MKNAVEKEDEDNRIYCDIAYGVESRIWNQERSYMTEKIESTLVWNTVYKLLLNKIDTVQ